MKRYIPLAVLSLVFAACSGNKNQNNAAQQVPEVPTTQVETRDITTYETYPATMEGIVNSEVRTKITGYITHVLVDEGQRVSKGQRLFKVETQSRSEDAQAAKANIQAAQVRVDQLMPLVEQKIISQSQLETAKAQLAQAEAAYQSIVADINYSNITSPVNGYVGEVRIRQGNLVSSSSSVPLTTISEIDQVYAFFTMNEKQYLNFIREIPGNSIQEKIKQLPEITLIMANGDTYPYQGKIETINSQVDKQSGTISFRAIFDNPEHILSNGSTGSVQIPKKHDNVIVIPQEATYESQDKLLVMKVDSADHGNSAAHLQTIEISDRTQGLYIVKSGIEVGDEIIIKGIHNIPDGSTVKTNKIPFETAIQAFTPVFEK